jgi:hypothetical protein
VARVDPAALGADRPLGRADWTRSTGEVPNLVGAFGSGRTPARPSRHGDRVGRGKGLGGSARPRRPDEVVEQLVARERQHGRPAQPDQAEVRQVARRPDLDGRRPSSPDAPAGSKATGPTASSQTSSIWPVSSSSATWAMIVAASFCHRTSGRPRLGRPLHRPLEAVDEHFLRGRLGQQGVGRLAAAAARSGVRRVSRPDCSSSGRASVMARQTIVRSTP